LIAFVKELVDSKIRDGAVTMLGIVLNKRVSYEQMVAFPIAMGFKPIAMQ